MEDAKETLCWTCKYIAKCNPPCRPTEHCGKYVRLKLLTYEQIGRQLGITDSAISAIIQKKGTQEIVRLMKKHGRVVTPYLGIKRYVFYEELYPPVGGK